MTHFDARVIGRGRAGGALATALRRAGWGVDGPLGRDHDAATATAGTAVVFLAVGDPDIAPLARSLQPGSAVVAHLSGRLGLDVLAPHERVASLHPLVALPDAETGAARLTGCWFATAGEAAERAVVERVVTALGARSAVVDDGHRTAYHAAAVVAANHVTALLGQVERLAADVGMPAAAFYDLARGAIDNAEALGPQAALTGPVARDDWATVAAHLAAIPAAERPTYAVLAEAARVLRDQEATPACG